MYSAGVLLFELLYHFTTETERQAAIGKLKKAPEEEKLPQDWQYPAYTDLLFKLVKEEPTERPSATEVSQQLSPR
ncbi:eukaryotic translation initiation factor 2-alpha kinase 3-like [Tripterygium wilfordii]|uniref:eukaryotic translation initiation factor 2-alpha kinase 3-like n=1 Tax=Tripterygium wilfordii TaxID=458696 RepID=UPI0018F82617|nr:eukaryotic translation initiation factor 2-alpha kinase 3-like [Tripterygium wilfordii]